MRKLAPARVSYRDDFLISYRVYMMTGSFHISLFEGNLHVDKIHVWFKIANITHALPVPVYRQTDFTPKRVVVSRLHDTVARFRTGVKFSPRYNNRGDSRRHGILWWYHVNKYRAMRGNRSELAPGRKSLRCHVNTPLIRTVDWSHLAASHAYIIYSLISSGHGQLLYVELFMLDEPNARTIDFAISISESHSQASPIWISFLTMFFILRSRRFFGVSFAFGSQSNG